MFAVNILSGRAIWLVFPASLLFLNCSSDGGGDNVGGSAAVSGGAAPTSGGAPSSGGTVASGGTVSSGGANGGAVSSGGANSSGGAANGGAANGGAANGGAANGGAANGGAANGGSATGGSMNRGGGGGVANGGGNAMGGATAGGSTGAGGGPKGGSTGAGGGTSSGTMTLTSSAYTEGMKIPDMYTCAGADTSPPLTWSAGPSGTTTYAVSLQDMSNNLYHWVIWDIPASVTMIDNVPAGAMPATPSGAQQRSFQANSPSFMGPCPSGMMHTYRFTVYALPVAMLTGIMANSSTMQIAAAITNAKPLATATLNGTSSASRM